MGMIITSGQPANPSDMRVESDKSAQRAINVPRGTGFSIAKTTGTIAAALAANSSFFAMRLDPSSANRAFIDRIRLQFTTIVAFTVPVTAGRRLGLYRGSGAAAGGGTAMPNASRKWTALGTTSEFDTANGGGMNIAAAAALTVAGIAFEADELFQMSLSHVGAAGAHHEAVLECNPSQSSEIVLEPGQLLAIRNPVAMDAGGTWQLSVGVQWREAPAY